MKYKEKILPARFLTRPNRFVATVDLEGVETVVHVKNTGRCRELLLPGTRVYLSQAENPARSTAYDLIAVEKVRPQGVLMVNIDSQLPNALVEEWLPHSGMFSGDAVVRREVTYGDSRFDLFVTDGTRRAFIEVKGVTLEHDGHAAFPDAPTERGIKHLKELCRAKEDGYEAYVVFVLQMEGMHTFSPNDTTHAAFGDALRQASQRGVNVLAMECHVTPDSVEITQGVKVEL